MVVWDPVVWIPIGSPKLKGIVTETTKQVGSHQASECNQLRLWRLWIEVDRDVLSFVDGIHAKMKEFNIVPFEKRGTMN